MSSRDAFERYADREEARLVEELNRGDISRADFNAAMRELQRDARDAYQADVDEAMDRVRAEWEW